MVPQEDLTVLSGGAILAGGRQHILDGGILSSEGGKSGVFLKSGIFRRRYHPLEGWHDTLGGWHNAFGGRQNTLRAA